MKGALSPRKNTFHFFDKDITTQNRKGKCLNMSKKWFLKRKPKMFKELVPMKGALSHLKTPFIFLD